MKKTYLSIVYGKKIRHLIEDERMDFETFREKVNALKGADGIARGLMLYRCHIHSIPKISLKDLLKDIHDSVIEQNHFTQIGYE